jgi:hypothetical protein
MGRDAAGARRVTAGALLLVVLVAGACRNDRNELTGSWTGSFNQIAQNRAGTIRLDISQSGTALGGRWEVEIPVDLRWGGSLEGSVMGSRVETRLVPDSAEICPYAWTASFGANRIQGPYQAYDCRVEIVGSIDVRRR